MPLICYVLYKDVYKRQLLTSKDIIYRNNAADIKMIVAVNEDQVINHIEASEEKMCIRDRYMLVSFFKRDRSVN